jgi:hypothetical protein
MSITPPALHGSTTVERSWFERGPPAFARSRLPDGRLARAVLLVQYRRQTVMAPPASPDVVLLVSEWPMRALLRAQLIEEGYDVVAVDAWPIPRQYLVSGMKPRVLVIDLLGLPRPRMVLEEVRYVIQPRHVIVLTALGTVDADDIRRLGFHAIDRPATVGSLVAAIKAVHES